MRKSTALVASAVALSAVVISLRIGELSSQQAIEVDFSSQPKATSSASPTPTETGTPTESGEPDTIPSAIPSASPKQTQASPVTISSDVIEYKYGVVQVSVTKIGSEITEVTLLQGDATNGRDKAYKILQDATLQVQGTNYGNVSGATFTTDAYKLAVENALSKF